MIINPDWCYKDYVKNIRTLKNSYVELLASFFNIREENNFIRTTRDNLYASNLEEYQKDRIWEYMNDYLTRFDILVFFGIWEGE